MVGVCVCYILLWLICNILTKICIIEVFWRTVMSFFSRSFNPSILIRSILHDLCDICVSGLLGMTSLLFNIGCLGWLCFFTWTKLVIMYNHACRRTCMLIWTTCMSICLTHRQIVGFLVQLCTATSVFEVKLTTQSTAFTGLSMLIDLGERKKLSNKDSLN